VAPIAAISEVAELNIGHFLIGEGRVHRARGRDPAGMRTLMDAARMPEPRTPHDSGIGSDLSDIRPDRGGARPASAIASPAAASPMSNGPAPNAKRNRAGGRAASYAKRFAPRRPAPRRSAPGSAAASTCATWAL
jgi:hypothetical protein